MALGDWTEKVGQAANEAVCSALSTNESFAGFVDSLYGTNWNRELAGGLRRGFCGDPSPAPAPDDYVPFSGGQCPGARYRVQADYQFTNSSSGSVDGNLDGPVELINPFSVPGVGTGFAFVGSGSGNVGQLISDSNFEGVSVSNINITRIDGGTDDCGDPPPEVPPYQPTTVNKNVTYVDNSDNSVTENYDFTVLAPIIVGGVILAPVTIAGNEVNLNGYLTLEGNFEFNVGTPPGSDTVTGGDPPDSTEDDADPESDERRIVGVLVTADVTSVSGSTVIAQTGNPDVYAPDLGLVSFAISVSSEAYGWTEDIRVKNIRQYIPCPTELGAISVKGTPRAGVSWTLTPIFRALDAGFTGT